MKSQSGSLLLETFIAMMILSVGVSGSLKVFGQALFSEKHVSELREARLLLDQELFYCFAFQGALDKLSEGTVKAPAFDVNNLRVEVESTNLANLFRDEKEKDRKDKPEREIQFYNVRARAVTDREREIFDLDTVILGNERSKTDGV